ARAAQRELIAAGWLGQRLRALLSDSLNEDPRWWRAAGRGCPRGETISMMQRRRRSACTPNIARQLNFYGEGAVSSSAARARLPAGSPSAEQMIKQNVSLYAPFTD